MCAHIWAYAKLLCYNLMTQTHAARATETGVGDSCIFNIVCKWIPSCMHACMHARVLCARAHCIEVCTHTYLCKCVQLCARVCSSAGVVSRNSALQTVFHLVSKAVFRQAARVPFFFFFLAHPLWKQIALIKSRQKKKISNKSMFGNQNETKSLPV